jgi:hypothetical protein
VNYGAAAGGLGPALIDLPSQPVRQVAPAVAIILIASASIRFVHENSTRG